jgi:pyruvate-formate lyase-activating enzyme
MKATSLSVNLMGPCNAHCPFCIATTTWKTGITDNRQLRRALPRALGYARYHGVDTVLITGSGEPTMHRDLVFHIITEARAAGIPITELQTNGTLLARESPYLEELAGLDLTTVAISVSSVDPARSAQLMDIELDYMDLLSQIAAHDILCRVTLNLIDHDREILLNKLGEYADSLYAAGARQLTLRSLGVPEKPVDTPDARNKVAWIKEHALAEKDVKTLEKEVRTRGALLRTLSYGATVYDYHNLSVTVATCMTEAEREDDIRSLILMPDGHVYHSWNYAGSVLL